MKVSGIKIIKMGCVHVSIHRINICIFLTNVHYKIKRKQFSSSSLVGQYSMRPLVCRGHAPSSDRGEESVQVGISGSSLLWSLVQSRFYPTVDDLSN